MNFEGYTFRLADFGDAVRVQKKFQHYTPHLQKLYGPIDLGRICELALFSLVALSPEGELVAFAAFDDNPLLPQGIAYFPQGTSAEESSINEPEKEAKVKADTEKAALNWATRTALGIGFQKEMLLWLTVCVSAVHTGAEEEAFVRAMLHTVLSLSYETRMILHTSSMELGAMPSLFRPVARNREFKFTLCVCTRSDVLPFLEIRRAREEDHDDLCPVIERAQKRGLPLTSIPSSAVPSKSYSVARFIRAQTTQNNVFVAEMLPDVNLLKLSPHIAIVDSTGATYVRPVDLAFRGASECSTTDVRCWADGIQVAGRIVGLIVLMSDVHLPSLHENYEVDTFEGLCEKRIERKLTVIETQAAAPDTFGLDPLGMANPLASLDSSVQPVPRPVTPPAGAGEKATKDGPEPDSGVEFVIDSPGNDTPEPEPEPEPEPAVEIIMKWPENVFRVVMLCMEEEFESRSIDMIEYGFKKLKKEFCLVTLPYTCHYHPLLKFFYRVRSRPNVQNQDPELSADKRCLYVLHVDGLSPDLGIRQANEDDLPQLEELLDDFADKDDLLSFITKPIPGRVNMVAAVPEQIVGYVLLARDPPVEAIASHFDVLSVIDSQYHPNENHISLILFVLNPIYHCRTRLFLQKIMKQLGKSVLYCPVFANQEVPEIVEDLILLPGRQHAHMAPPCYWEKASRENTPAAVMTQTSPEALDAAAKDRVLGDQGAVPPEEEGTTKEKKLPFVEDIMKRRSSIDYDKPRPSIVVSVDPVPEEFHRQSHRKSIIINETLNEPDDDDGDSGADVDSPPDHRHSEYWDTDAPTEYVADLPPQKPPTRKMSVGVGFEVQLEISREMSILRDEAEDGSEGNLKKDGQTETNPRKSSLLDRIRDEEAKGGHDGIPEKRKSSVLQWVRAGVEYAEVQQERAIEEAGQEKGRKSSLRHETATKKSVTIGVDRKKSVYSTGREESVASVRASTTLRAASKSKQARGSYFGFDCSCYIMSRRFLYRYRTVVNARIVVVGSSITTAAFFHQLITSHELQFTSLIMVSTVGFKCLMSTALSQIIVDLGPAYAFTKLGLDCHIDVVIATVTGIDRKGHSLALSNADVLTYDWLILSSGLQDQTKNRLGLSPVFSNTNEHIGIVKTDEIILNAHEISQGMAVHAVVGDSIPPVVIYGSTLEAFCAVQKLLQEGLQGPNILLIHPEPLDLASAAGTHLGDSDISCKLVDTLLRSGVSVHSGLKLVGVEMNETNEWIRVLQFEEQVSEENLDGMSVEPMTLEEMNKVMASKPVEDSVPIYPEVPLCPIHRSQEVVSITHRESKITYVVEKGRRPKRPLEQPCSLLVTCDTRQVDLSLFHALNQASIIFDSRVVVDGIFRTNDPSIFAAGSLCKFSRYCGKELPKLERFCGWEVGEAFAAAFAVIVTQAMFRQQVPADHENGFVPMSLLPKWPAPALPSLKKPRCIGGFVPGDKWFFTAAAPKFCVASAGRAARTLYTRLDSAFTRLDIMENGEVGKFFYLGDKRIPEWKMVRFVGLPASVLRNIVIRHDRGEISSLVDTLLEPWSAIVLHDSYIPFVEDTMDAVDRVIRKSKLMNEAKTQLRSTNSVALEEHIMTEAGNVVTEFLWTFIKAHKSALPHFALPLLPILDRGKDPRSRSSSTTER